MDLTCIPDEWWIERGPQMFRAIVGGDTEWAILADHWRGMSDRLLEAKHGVPRTTARRWITQAKMRLRRAGFDVDLIQGYADRHTTQPDTLTTP